MGTVSDYTKTIMIYNTVFCDKMPDMKNTIKAHKNFNFGEGRGAATPALIIKQRPKLFEKSQYGLVANKRTFPLAVDRNRAKRLMRVWLQATGRPNEMDIIIIARLPILETKREDGIRQMKYCMKKLKQLTAGK